MQTYTPQGFLAFEFNGEIFISMRDIYRAVRVGDVSEISISQAINKIRKNLEAAGEPGFGYFGPRRHVCIQPELVRRYFKHYPKTKGIPFSEFEALCTQLEALSTKDLVQYRPERATDDAFTTIVNNLAQNRDIAVNAGMDDIADQMRQAIQFVRNRTCNRTPTAR